MWAAYTCEVLVTLLKMIFPVSPESLGYDGATLDPLLNDDITRAAWLLLNVVPKNSFLSGSCNPKLFDTKLKIKASAMSQLGNNTIFAAFTIYLPSLGVIFWNS